jgi:N-dimethylarginine dimethylaminohydrolase
MVLVNYNSEYTRLKKVALYRPNFDEVEQIDVKNVMYTEIPDPKAVYEEFDGIVDKLRSLGVEVIVLEDKENYTHTSNMIFLRDVAMVFRNKIVLANMKYGIRKKEPEKFKYLLEKNNHRYSDSFINLDNNAIMEGADIFVLSLDLLYIYQNNRTNSNATSEIKARFSNVQIHTIKADIFDIPQHILGGVHIIDEKLAARRVEYCHNPIGDIDFIDFTETSEIREGFGLNIVTISPSEILMPSNRPDIKQRLESAGIVCHEIKIEEIYKMGGGLACMVLPLVRE